MNNETPYQRHLKRLGRTPTSEADRLMKNLEDAYQRLVDNWNSDPRTPDEDKIDNLPLHETAFFNELIKHGAASGDELVEAYQLRHPASEEGIFDLNESESLPIALAYCIQAYRADAAGKRDLAWTYIIDSRTWFTPSLMLKPGRISKLNKVKKKPGDCSAAAAIKDEIYNKKQREFIKKLYESGEWIGKVVIKDKGGSQVIKDKTGAIIYIAGELEKYAQAENLPIEQTKSNESRDWYRYVERLFPATAGEVKNRIRQTSKKIPPAK